MKKILLSLITLVCLSFFAQAQIQQFVLEGDGAKHAILEEFTGVKCGNCPAGHTEADNIQSANPGLVHVIAFPPTNSGYTDPAGTAGTDFRRSFADAFYTASYCSPGTNSRFMPSAFINRKIGGDGNILQGRNSWSPMVTTTVAETPVLNIAAKSYHNANANSLTVDVQVYYTSTVTNNNALYVVLTQDDLTSDYQSGSSASASSPYIYKHTFRENISSGQWGDDVIGATTQGSLYSRQYTFDLSSAQDPIDVSKAHIVAYVVDATTSNKEVLNGIGIKADGGAASTGSAPTNVNDLHSKGSIEIFPNPTSGDLFVGINNNEKDVTIKVLNLLGKIVYQTEANGNAQVKIEGSSFPSAGVYFVELSNEVSKVTKKVIIK